MNRYPEFDDDDDNDSAKMFFDEGYGPVLAIDENGKPDEHLPAIGVLERYGARVDELSKRAKWGTIAWIYEDDIADGEDAHLCLPWSEVCTTSTSFEWQYEAVYVYSDVFYDNSPSHCGRVRVKAHEIFTLVGDSLWSGP